MRCTTFAILAATLCAWLLAVVAPKSSSLSPPAGEDKQPGGRELVPDAGRQVPKFTVTLRLPARGGKDGYRQLDPIHIEYEIRLKDEGAGGPPIFHQSYPYPPCIELHVVRSGGEVPWTRYSSTKLCGYLRSAGRARILHREKPVVGVIPLNLVRDMTIPGDYAVWVDAVLLKTKVRRGGPDPIIQYEEWTRVRSNEIEIKVEPRLR